MPATCLVSYCLYAVVSNITVLWESYSGKALEYLYVTDAIEEAITNYERDFR